MKTPIAVWRDTFAPYSETFIWNEVRHHVRYRVTVFARRRLNAASFPYDDVVTLDGPPLLGMLERVLCRTTSLSPRFAYRLYRDRFALIHAHFGTAAVHALPYAFAFRVPLIASFHGKDVSVLVGALSRYPRYWLYRLWAQRLFRDSALVLAASRDLYEQLVRAGCPESKLHVFRLGIDLSLFRRARRPEVATHIILVGRLVTKKGFRYALEAIGRQHRRGAALRVTVAGDGPLKAELQALARRVGIASVTSFAGVLRPQAVSDLMSDADLIMAPSVVTDLEDRDSGVISVKEAAASQLPCVGTLHGGLPDIVQDSETGFLVSEHDVEALTHRLGQLINDDQLRQRMGHKARAKMEREYDIHSRMQELERHYDDVSSCHPSHDTTKLS